MAVETNHLNLFPPLNGNGSVFGVPVGPSTAEAVIPTYGGSEFAGGNFPAVMKCDSGLTYASISRKRPREAVISPFPTAAVNDSNSRGGFTFLGEDISFQIQHQQSEIDRFISHHTDMLRIEIAARRRSYSRRIAAAVEATVIKKLISREEEIHKIGKLNHALEERLKSLCAENQIWRDLAESTEATANALRSDLEHVLTQVQDEQPPDSGSSSGSNDVRRTLPDFRCRSCEREESCVLLLPCRHLCLCTGCGSTLHTCPVCNATKTASVHVIRI